MRFTSKDASKVGKVAKMSTQETQETGLSMEILQKVVNVRKF